MTSSAESVFPRFLSFQLAMSVASALTSPFWVVLLSGTGLTYVQISALVAASYAATLLFEIPTGVLADVHGRKLSVLLGIGVNAATSIGISLWFYSLPLLFAMFVLQGIGATFMTGAFGAWMTDSLLRTIKEEELPEYWGRLASNGRLGALLGFAGGTGLVAIGVGRGLWLASGIIGFFALLFAMHYIPEAKAERPESGKSGSGPKAYWRVLATGSLTLLRKADLRRLTMASFIWFVGTGVLSLAWQPHMQSAGVPIALFGPILMIYTFLGALCARKTGWFVKRLKGEARSLGLSGILSAGLTALMVPACAFAGVPFLLFGASESLHAPMFNAFLNRRIGSSERATILSAHSMVTSISTLLAMWTFGMLADSLGVAISIGCAAVVMLMAALSFLTVGPDSGSQGDYNPS